jgi:hypothetical protein
MYSKSGPYLATVRRRTAEQICLTVHMYGISGAFDTIRNFKIAIGMPTKVTREMEMNYPLMMIGIFCYC